MTEDILEVWRVHDAIRQVLLALKQSGVRMPEEAKFGIWEHWMKPKLAMR